MFGAFAMLVALFLLVAVMDFVAINFAKSKAVTQEIERPERIDMEEWY